VAIYGSFNNWIQTQNYCAKETDGGVCRVDLAPGKCTYKFLIDGVGLNDPANSATEDDGQGDIDSVIVIKPKVRRTENILGPNFFKLIVDGSKDSRHELKTAVSEPVVRLQSFI
jgi:hypothetical protein